MGVIGGPRRRSAVYAQVAVARPVGGPFSYSVPAWMAGELAVGHVVLVPFGRRGSETGYVVGFTKDPGFDPAKIKAVERLLDPVPGFDERQLRFFRWVADYYMASLGMVIQTALPSQIRARTLNVLQPTPEGADALVSGDGEPRHLQVLREVTSRPGLTRKGYARRLSEELEKADVNKALDAIARRGWAEWIDKELKETRATITTVKLLVPEHEVQEVVPRMGARMKALVASIAAAPGPVDVRELVAEQGSSARSSLQRLVEAGVLELEDREDRDALADAPALGASVPPQLNDDQLNALTALTAPDAKGAFLLYGVTGSGKTEVFLGAARHALDAGRQVLVLVPEIGLTPQLVGRFKARFGELVAVLHSGLTGSQRLAEWRRIRAGEAQVAVGARSALFAPFHRLGLVVVDEEHDDSYKQDDGVRYHARDLAVVMGREHECPVVLASATPSLESWHNATQGRYGLLRLPKRATPRAVPIVERIDMTDLERGADGQRPLFHPDCEQALRDTFTNGGQAIVLYNRRGYATMVECTSCGGTYECPSCGIAMTLHRRAGTVACHYCGFKRPASDTCPSCGSQSMEELGKGTERIEEELNRLFPEVPSARMDADTTAVRGSHHRILSAFRRGETQLLTGTQIVAKGHDFPNVRTVVVVSADHGLRMPDFRAAERTYSLLVQMAGRAGRGDVPGRVMVQTWIDDHYVLDHLDDVSAFMEIELRQRELLRYPPWRRLCLIRVDGVDRREVTSQADEVAQGLTGLAKKFPGVEVMGPSPAALARLVGRWRWQIILRGGDLRAFRAFLHAARPHLEKAGRKGVRVGWDVDPRSLM